jgi:hypothetical protein
MTLRAYFDQPHDYVTIKVFTTAFRRVYESTVRYVPAGPFQVAVDTNDFSGGRMPADGLYYMTVTTPLDRWILKFLILR